MGSLASLTDLRLSGNRLVGCLPRELLHALEGAELSELALPLCEPSTADRDALTAIYNATNGANWTREHNWLSEYPIGKWSGVEVNARGRVVSLRLNENGLSGEIPREVGDFAHIERLYLAGNRLTGEIPPELGSLAYLNELRLSGNQLTGCIPDALRRVNHSDFGDTGLPFCQP